jgi:hypothetical protein
VDRRAWPWTIVTGGRRTDDLVSEQTWRHPAATLNTPPPDSQAALQDTERGLASICSSVLVRRLPRPRPEKTARVQEDMDIP